MVPNSAARLAPPVVNEVLHSSGQPLGATVRGHMESLFGQDFSRVRVHTDARAADSARAVDALAYTVGHHVIFGAGRYQPTTPDGRRLLAHELAHTAQQGPSDFAVQPGLQIGAAHDPAEHEAERAAAVPESTRTPIGTTPFQLARKPAPGNPDTCDAANCTGSQPGTIRGDITRAIGYVSGALAALAHTPLDRATERALDWYFGGHDQATVNTVQTRLGCIRGCLTDTQASNRWGCDPNDPGPAYTDMAGTAVCSDSKATICLADSHFGTGDRVRAETVIHECAHRVGMSLGRPASVPDIYESSPEFLNISTEDALRTSESFALFAGAVAGGVPVSILKTAGLFAGAAIPSKGSATWQARLYFGAEFQHPVLGLFNPTLGLGLGLIGEPTTGGPAAPASPSTTLLVSLLPGFRFTNPRPGASGSVYAQFFGGPALAFGATTAVGAEAGVALGYRWRWLDVSAGVGYAYDPTRKAGLEHMIVPSIGITFNMGAR